MGGSIRLRELALLRQGAYRLLATTFLYPNPERIQTVSLLAASLGEASHPFAEFSFWIQWKRLLAALWGLRDTDRAALEAAYVPNFMVSSEAALCGAYESAHVEKEATGRVLAELDREYARAGLLLAEVCPDPPDHIAVELEFMSVLCGGEAEAWRRKAVDDAAAQLEREARFLGRHLGWWLPEFASTVARHDPDSLYAIATDAAWAFVSHEKDLVATLLTRFQRLAAERSSGGDR